MISPTGRVRTLTDTLSTQTGQTWLRRGIWSLLAVGALVALLVGADRPARAHELSPAALAATTAHSRPSRVFGFNQVGFRVVTAGHGGLGRPGCALLADTPPRQQQGMKGRHDLAGYDAMVFRFPADTTVPFYNQGVPVPLSLAWFDSAGVYIGATPLAVCNAACPTVAPVVAFRMALEVLQGGLGHLGVGPGSALLVGGACS